MFHDKQASNCFTSPTKQQRRTSNINCSDQQDNYLKLGKGLTIIFFVSAGGTKSTGMSNGLLRPIILQMINLLFMTKFVAMNVNLAGYRIFSDGNNVA